MITYTYFILGAATVAGLFRACGFLPEIARKTPRREICTFLGVFALALVSGRALSSGGALVVSLVLAMLVPMITLLVNVFGSRHNSLLIVGTGLWWLVGSAGSAEAAIGCGQVTRIVEGDSPVGVTTKIVVRRAGSVIEEVRAGDRILSGDEVLWGGSVGFSVSYVDGSAQIFEPSKTAAMLDVRCEQRSGVAIWVSVQQVASRIRTFLKEKGELSMSVDKEVSAGFPHTSFDLIVDSQKRLVVAVVFEGRIEMKNRFGSTIVGSLEDAAIPYDSQPLPAASVPPLRLKSIRMSVLSGTRQYGIYGHSSVEKAVGTVERRILEVEKNDPRWQPSIPKYIVGPGDTIHDIILRYYPVLTEEGKMEAVQAISRGIEKANPVIRDIDTIRPGQELKLPEVEKSQIQIRRSR